MAISRLFSRARSVAPAAARRLPALQVERLEDRLALSSTPAKLVLPKSVTEVNKVQSVNFPNSAIVQIETMRQTSKGLESFVGSGILIAPNWVLTAGHNIYGGKGIGWATKVAVHAGQTAQTVGNKEVAYRPFGEAMFTTMVVPGKWADKDQNYDIGLIQLDRNLGSAKFAKRMDYGWLPESFFAGHGTVRMLGYPAKEGYGGKYLYSSKTKAEKVFSLNANPYFSSPREVAGGQVFSFPYSEVAGAEGASGSPVFVDPMDRNPKWGKVHTVVGVYARGPDGQGEATRITPQLFNWINEWVNPVIVNNRYTFPDKAGIDKPDLMSYADWFKVSGKNTAYTITPKAPATPKGNEPYKLNVNLQVWNGGTAASKAVKVEFYLAAQSINVQDPNLDWSKLRLLGSAPLAAMGALNRNGLVVAKKSFDLPKDLPGGTFQVVYRIDPGHTQQEFTSNIDGVNNNVGTFFGMSPIQHKADGSWTTGVASSRAASVAAGLFLGVVDASPATPAAQAQFVQGPADHAAAEARPIDAAAPLPVRAASLPELPSTTRATAAAVDAVFADLDTLLWRQAI